MKKSFFSLISGNFKQIRPFSCLWRRKLKCYRFSFFWHNWTEYGRASNFRWRNLTPKVKVHESRRFVEIRNFLLKTWIFSRKWPLFWAQSAKFAHRRNVYDPVCNKKWSNRAQHTPGNNTSDYYRQFFPILHTNFRTLPWVFLWLFTLLPTATEQDHRHAHRDILTAKNYGVTFKGFWEKTLSCLGS